ncbi:MAG TPA: hypothetical protein VGR14_13030 [Verrucomicrobiae bacterium]|jgi:hypothetical protein|nr:hypothetical protein [Verrucomicrobiae bacterium]
MNATAHETLQNWKAARELIALSLDAIRAGTVAIPVGIAAMETGAVRPDRQEIAVVFAAGKFSVKTGLEAIITSANQIEQAMCFMAPILNAAEKALTDTSEA